MKRLGKKEFDARVKALRECASVPEAKELLDSTGYPVDYEALASFATRNRTLIHSEPDNAEQALRAIIKRIDAVGKDPGHFAMASALGEVKSLAKKGLGET